MAITHVALFGTPQNKSEDILQKALVSQETSSSQESVAGIQIQDRNTIQVTTDASSLEDSNLFRTLRETCGEPKETYHVNFDTSPLSTNGAATAPVVEVVPNFIPVSRLTPEFRAQVEADFQKFDGICKTMAEGDAGLSYGWGMEEQDHDDVKGEKVRPFFIMRGWRSMRDFENLTKQQRFGKEAIPILLAWEAPFRMVSL